MDKTERKEPGRADVVQRERGDLRQHDNPIRKQTEQTDPAKTGKSDSGSGQDHPPAGRGTESPWLGGG